MPRLWSPSLQVGLSRQAVTLQRVERRGRSTALPGVRVAEANGVASHEPLVAALNAALKGAQCRRMRARVVLADELVRFFWVAPPQNAGGLRDCRAAAQLRFQLLYGEPAAAWRIEADWDAREPFLACAMPAHLLDALQAAAAEHGLDLIETCPQFVAAWNRWHGQLQGDAWFGAVHDDGMTVGAIQEGRLRAVRSLDAAPQDARDALAREALLLNLPIPVQLQWTSASLDALACVDLGAGTERRA